MADRSVVVRLKASVTDFQAGMASAGRSTAELQRKLAEGDAKQKISQQQVTRGMMLVGVAGVAAAGVAVKAFAGFDKEMSNVKAVSGATAGEMDRLREAALKAGADTVFSASEAAKAEAELTRAGVKTADVLGGALRGSLDLAAAGQLELADAATISAQAMNIFKLGGEDVTHIADVLAAGANKSAADVKGLGDALRQGGLVASQTGLGLEETVGALSAFADSALIGSDAGTSLKTMLQRLTPTSDEAAGVMDDLGFSAYDAQGNFIGLEALAGELQTSFGTLTTEQRNLAMATVFGSDAVRAANVLYEQGAMGVADYTRAVDDNGAATRNAATQLDNLAGDLEALKGSFETALIQSGSGANSSLRSLTQVATGAVNAFADLPAPLQTTGVLVAGLGGAALFATGAVISLSTKALAARASLIALGTGGAAAARGLTLASKAGGALLLGLTALVAADSAMNGANSGFMRYVETLEAKAGGTARGKIAALTAEMEKLQKFADEGIGFEAFGFAVKPTDWTGDNADAADQVDALKDRIAELKHEMKLAGIESETTGDSAAGLGSTLEDVVSPAVDDATEGFEDYKTALDNLNGVNITAARAQLDLADAIKEARKATDDKVKVTADEDRALLDLADQANQTAGAILDQNGSQEKANKSLREARRAFIDTAVEMGYTREEARGLADDFLAIPTVVETEVKTPGLNRAIERIKALRAEAGVPIAVTVGMLNKLGANPAIDGRRAHGGPVWPSGTFLVGEQGPELFSPSTRGSISPLSGSTPVAAGAYSGRPAPAGGSGVTFDVKQHITSVDPRQSAAESTAALRGFVFERTGSVV